MILNLALLYTLLPKVVTSFIACPDFTTRKEMRADLAHFLSSNTLHHKSRRFSAIELFKSTKITVASANPKLSGNPSSLYLLICSIILSLLPLYNCTNASAFQNIKIFFHYVYAYLTQVWKNCSVIR